MRWPLLLALPLLGGEALTAVLAFAPRADPAYRAVYIDRTRDCWLPPGTVPEAPTGDIILPATLSAATACTMLPKGWNPPDKWGVWSNGSEAEIAVPLRPVDRSVTLLLTGFSPMTAQHVRWDAGGQAGSVALPPGQAVAVRVFLSPGVGPVLLIRLHIAHVHRPLDTDVEDWRAIGVALRQVVRGP